MTNEALNQELSKLVAEVCQYPKHSRERRKILNKLIFRMQHSKNHEPAPIPPACSPEEREAQQRTWIWFCEHIDEFDPNRGSVVGWFMNRLKFRRKDVRLEEGNRRSEKHYSYLDSKSSIRSGEEVVTDKEAARNKNEFEIDKDLAKQILIKAQRRLKRIHLKEKTAVNCFDVAYSLLEGKTLVEIAEQHSLSRPQMSRFFNDRCMEVLISLRN